MPIFERQTPPEGILLVQDVVTYQFVTVLELQCPGARIISGSIRVEPGPRSSTTAIMTAYILRVFLGKGGLRHLFQEFLLGPHSTATFEASEQMWDEIIVKATPIVISTNAQCIAKAALKAVA